MLPAPRLIDSLKYKIMFASMATPVASSAGLNEAVGGVESGETSIV
jgi:hypothetical protein